MKKKSSVLMVLVLISTVVLFSMIFVQNVSSDPQPATWWNYDWSCRRQITIDHDFIDSDLTNFPVLVVINPTIGAKCDGGNSIRFLSADNSNEYYYEIEEWNGGSGNSYVWVNVTSISSSSDTTFLMYYGNAGVSDGQSPSNVWHSSYIMVHHLTDSTTSTVSDSTANNHDGTKTGANDPLESTAKITKGQFFDDTNDRVNLGDDADYALGTDFTIALWIKHTEDLYTYYTGQFESSNNYWVAQNYVGKLGWGANNGVGGTNYYTGAFDPSPNVWYYLVWQVSSSTLTCYVNTSNIGSTAILNVQDCDANLNLGQVLDSGSTHYVKGTLDEIRFSTVARNTSWISASFHAQNQTVGFLIFGDEQTVPSPVRPVGGIIVPVDKLGLLAPDISITFLAIMITATTTIICVKHRKKKQ